MKEIFVTTIWRQFKNALTIFTCLIIAGAIYPIILVLIGIDVLFGGSEDDYVLPNPT